MKKYNNYYNSNSLEILFLVFLVLKLTNVIDWSWWWVTSPIWIPMIFVFILLCVIGMAKLFFNK